MSREDRQGRSKKQLQYSERVAAVSFIGMVVVALSVYVYQLIFV